MALIQKCWLVVDLPLWKILVSWGYYSQYIYIYIKKRNVPNHQPEWDIPSVHGHFEREHLIDHWMLGEHM